MKMKRALLLLGVASLLQGCALAAGAGYLVYENETARLEALRTWEEGLKPLDCAGLDNAQAELESEKEELFDFDQRESALKTERAEKGCT